MEHQRVDVDDPVTSGCLSPDQENCENSHDEKMYRAINKFIGTREQSYEEFLDGFTSITIEDVTKYERSSDILTDNSETHIVHDYPKKEEEAKTAAVLEEDIEEEVLAEGPVHGTMSACTGKRAIVKFDNFVEAEDEELDTESTEDLGKLLGTMGYTASFLECGLGETTHIKPTDGSPDKFSPSLSEKINLTTINFGEVEPDNDSSCLREISGNHTILDITSSNPCGEDERTSYDKMVLDDVEEFHLDPDFDYDNVKLTPKYSEEDLRIIMCGLDNSPVSAAH